MYFRLNPECYFVRGKKCGAIFDLISGKIYALDSQETKILTSCEKNNPAPDSTFLNELKELCLGNFYPNKTYIQKLRSGILSQIHETNVPLELNRAFIEINNSCNENCDYCGFYGVKRNLSCLGCNKWDENDEYLNSKRIKETIDELKDLGCQDIYITGGNLTLKWKKTMDIVNYANGKFMNIFIILSYQNLSQDIIKDLKNKAIMIIQTDLDTINSKDFIYSKDFFYLLVIKPEDHEKVIEINSENIIKSFIIEDKNSIINLSMDPKKKHPPINMHQFLNNLEYHPCIGHTISISYSGNVTPCITMRNHVFGNIRNKSLSSIFKEKMEYIGRFWKLNLDEIEKCTYCEFRYLCTDCRALEENLTGELTGKILCGYKPKEGEWP